MVRETMNSDNKWLNTPSMLASRPFFKLIIGNYGFYILNAYNFIIFPKFYYIKRDCYIECGVSFVGCLFEMQIQYDASRSCKEEKSDLTTQE